MLNSSEIKIMKVMKDNKYLQFLGAEQKDIEKIIDKAIKEFIELEVIVKAASANGEGFQMLCNRLGGHNELFSAEYPNHNYFDLNYKSLLVTVCEETDDNKSNQYKVQKTDVYIYPDSIKQTIDPMCIIDLDKEINFQNIYQELIKEIENSEEVL